jgi:Conjugal transfer protein TraD
MNNDEWLKDRVAYLKGLKSRNEQQELLVLLAEKTNRTAQDDKKFNAIIRAEKASQRATKARQDAARLINDENRAVAKAERAARTHELCNSAGLLILAGLVDTKTGKPAIDKGELLGALLGLAKVPAEDPRRKEWKRAGDAIIADTSTQ